VMRIFFRVRSILEKEVEVCFTPIGRFRRCHRRQGAGGLRRSLESAAIAIYRAALPFLSVV